MQINSNLPAVLNNAEEMKQKEHIYNILPVFKGWNTTAIDEQHVLSMRALGIHYIYKKQSLQKNYIIKTLEQYLVMLFLPLLPVV